MKYLPESVAANLYNEARLAADNSYSPYSKFPVGAAVLASDGQIYRGTNIENASYGLTICAERIALGNTISSGHREIEAIAIYSASDTVPPCGACRQFIIEFGENIIVLFKKKGAITQVAISDLLPDAFQNANLNH